MHNYLYCVFPVVEAVLTQVILQLEFKNISPLLRATNCLRTDGHAGVKRNCRLGGKNQWN